MVARLSERDDSGDEFKQDFVVLVANTLMKGKQDNYTNFNVLYSTMNVAGISNLDWCNYTIKSLVSASEEWKKGRSAFFKGPTTLLVLCYLDRVVFKARTIPRQFPVCSNWDYEKIAERISLEKKAGGFDKGKCVKILTKPLPTPSKTDISCLEDQHPKDSKPNEEVNVEDTTKLTAALGKMTDAVVDFAKVMFEIGKEGSVAAILKNAFAKMVIPEEMVQPSPPQNFNVTMEPLDDDFFNQPDVIKALEQFENAYYAANEGKKKNKVNHPDDTPTCSLQISVLHEELPEGDARPAGVEQTSREMTELEFFDVVEESEDELMDVMVRTRPHRRFKNLETHLTSKFWNLINRTNTNISKKEQIMSNYAFLPITEENKGKKLYEGQNLLAFRSDFATLLPNQWVLNNLLDIWCLKLNIDNSRRKDGPNRIFFSTVVAAQLSFNKEQSSLVSSFRNAMDSELQMLANNPIESADLILYPIIKDDHYWIACINLLTNRIDIIDNKTLPPNFRAVDRYDGLPTELAFHLAAYARDKK